VGLFLFRRNPTLIMDRRKFTLTLAEMAVGTYGVARNPALLAEPAAAGQQGEASTVPFQISIMLWSVFAQLPFIERLEKVAEAGYRNAELVGEYASWTDEEFARINAKRRELGIHFDCTAGLKHGVSNPANREALLTEMRAALPIMERLECPSMILLSGNRVPGVSPTVQHESCIDALKALATLVDGKVINGAPVRLLLETIDPEENPRCYLTQINEALEIVEAVGHPQVQLLYDFYHEQISAGNLIEKLEKSISHLGLVHIADVPGRHQPGTGEINYQNIYRKLAQLNYAGMVAMEFHPDGDPVALLRAAREMALQPH